MTDKDISSANKDFSIKGIPSMGAKDDKLAGLMGKDVRKRWIIVGTVSAVMLAIMATWASSNGEPKKRTPKQKFETVVDTTPKGLSGSTDWKAQTSADMQVVQETLEANRIAQRELLDTVARMDAELKELKKNGGGGSSANQRSTATTRPALNIPAPPKAPISTQRPSTPVTNMNPGVQQQGVGGQVAGTSALTAPKPVEVKRTPARSFGPTSASSKAAVAGTEIKSMVPNDRQGYLPAGSFAEATLISGVEAFTGGTAQSQPQPVVIRINEHAILPNAAAYKLKGCHVLASVWGDMSSERVFGRLATLTCVDANNQLVLSEEVEGSLVDSDGKNGVRGELLDRQGAKLARALLAGFAEGLSSAFGAAQSTVTQTGLGTTTALLGSNTLKAGAYSGAATAAEELADFYMKQAESTMPVIAVDAGRNISVMFTKSKSLKFETTGSYREDKPKKLQVELPTR